MADSQELIRLTEEVEEHTTVEGADRQVGRAKRGPRGGCLRKHARGTRLIGQFKDYTRGSLRAGSRVFYSTRNTLLISSIALWPTNLSGSRGTSTIGFPFHV
jgi:hypothetical protein